jgi:malate dehydrogenase
LCDGEYGLKDVVVGVPVKIGRGGAEQILEYELTSDERAALDTSANAVRELCRTVDRLMA